METEVLMKRELFGMEINQKSKSEFFSATDLVKAGNRWRAINGMPLFNMELWFRNQSTKEFIVSLQEKYGKVKINSTGKNRHTWVHPFIFIDLALAISPELKIEVYSWLYDSLLKYRNESGDSYKKLTGALYLSITNKSFFKDKIQEIANRIRIECKVIDWNKATEEELKLRDKIQEYIALYCDVLPIDEAVSIGIKRAKDRK